jgi:hypothetical protein
MPYAEGVRSLSRPNTGAANTVSSPPTPVTRARLAGACSVPTRDRILRASVTSRGAISISATLMYAKAYVVTNPAPTGAGSGRPVRAREPLASLMSLSSAAGRTWVAAKAWFHGRAR